MSTNVFRFSRSFDGLVPQHLKGQRIPQRVNIKDKAEDSRVQVFSPVQVVFFVGEDTLRVMIVLCTKSPRNV